jgi:hypothetical protein
MFLQKWLNFPPALCFKKKKKLDDNSRLDVVEILPVPDILLSLLPSWSG